MNVTKAGGPVVYIPVQAINPLVPTSGEPIALVLAARPDLVKPAGGAGGSGHATTEGGKSHSVAPPGPVGPGKDVVTSHHARTPARPEDAVGAAATGKVDLYA